MAVLLLSSAARYWIEARPTSVKLGRSSVSKSIDCVTESGGVMRIDYDLWLGTSHAGNLPTDTGVQVSLRRWPDENADAAGKPTYAAAIETIRAEFAAMCERHGCPQIPAMVDVEKGAGNLRVQHTEYSARRRWLEGLEFVSIASLMACVIGTLGLVTVAMRRWHVKRTIPA